MTPLEADLVGREGELDALAAFLGAVDQLPGALVIEGPAGAGKTTLWKAAVDLARDAGYLVLQCRAAGAEVKLSFAALSDLLEPHLDAALPGLPLPQRHALEVALLLAEDRDRPPDERAVATAALNVLRTLAASQPVLIAVDDAQWVDPPSAEVLEYALRRLRTARIAAITSWRSGSSTAATVGPTSGLRLERALDDVPPRLAVEPLSLGALHRLLRARTALEFNRRTLQRIHETSGGNPFYALELARAIESRQQAAGGSEPLPLSASLNELLADRLAFLEDDARGALFVVAAASQPTVALVAGVVGRPAELALGSAIKASIVRIEGEAIEFTHPLLAAAAYSGAGPSERREWHAKLADASTDPEARARHLALARSGANLEVATTLRDAARHALARGAPGVAAELFGDAIDRLPAPAAAERIAWTLEAGPVLIQSGDRNRARSVLETAVAEMAAGPDRSAALLLLSNVVENDPRGAVLGLLLVEQAIAEAGSDSRRRAAALLDREMLERSNDRLALALEIAREALIVAEQSGDESLLAAALTRTADLEVVLGLGGEPVARFERALELDARTHVDPAAGAPAMLAVCLIRAGRLEEARPYLLECRRRATAEGDDEGRQQLDLFLTELEWLAGNWDVAQGHAEEGLQLAEQARSRMRQGTLRTMLALLEASRGDPDSARSHAVAARVLHDEVGEVAYGIYARSVLGFLELSLGNAAAAHEQLDTYSVERGIEGTKRLSFIADEIEALTLLGELDRAAELVAELERRGATLNRPPLTAAAARSRALVLGARGDLDGAIQAAEAAVAAYASLQLPFEQARALLVLGEVQRRTKQRRVARETLTEAAAAFDRLGARRWAERAEAERARIGGRSTIEGLSETELRVAQLVAEGRSNKEVAAELFVSVRAVESNLSKIYLKLGIRSRTELARRL